MENKNTCQVCVREIKSKSGIIAHHGYTRLEHGWQTSSCIGARNLPYEKSRDVIPKAIDGIKKFIRLKQAEIKSVKEKSTPVLFLRNTISSDNSQYKIRQGEYLIKLEYDIKSASREIERLQKRYDEWKLNDDVFIRGGYLKRQIVVNLIKKLDKLAGEKLINGK